MLTGHQSQDRSEVAQLVPRHLRDFDSSPATISPAPHEAALATATTQRLDGPLQLSASLFVQLSSIAESCPASSRSSSCCWIAALEPGRTSWTALLDAQRL
jgi:hypothetical protein